jgi:stage II sporulation protein D
MDATAPRLALFAVIAFLAVLVPLGCREQNAVSLQTRAPIVRVELIQAADSVLVCARGSPLVKSAGQSAPQRLRFPDSSVLISLAPDGWHIGTLVLPGGELAIQAEQEGGFSIEDKAKTPLVMRSYRGGFRFVPVAGPQGSPLRFDVINDVDVDSYLMSVVTGEMPRTFADEAYKAQAIVARTYALYEAKTTGVGRNFDVFDDTRSQAYAGMAAETDRSREAVAQTSGIVVAAGPPGQERIFKAYFSACCGGIGQSANDAFGDPPSRELTEQKVGSLCNESPRFNWAPIDMSKAELTRRIRAWGAKRGHAVKDMAALARLDILQRNQFGRPVRFVLTDARGDRYSLSGEETRWACNADAPSGAPTLFSSFFNPINGPDTIRFSDGHGSGHGVGMCQWCAQARAERGMRHEDIVILSYPGSKLVRAY